MISVRITIWCYSVYEGDRDEAGVRHSADLQGVPGAKDSYFYLLSNSNLDWVFALLDTVPERTELPDLQDEVDADDHSPRDFDEDQERV